MLENTFGSISFAGTLEENMGGVRLFRFAPVAYFSALGPGIQGTVITAPTWAGEDDWHTMRVIEDSANFNEEMDRKNGGPIWENAFTGELAGDANAKRMQYDSMVRVEVIAEVVDNNGRVRRMGELGDPAYITMSHSTGRGGAARNGWNVRIEWNSERACFVVDADFVPTPPPEPDPEDSGSVGEASGELGG